MPLAYRRTAVLGSTETPLNVSSVSTTFPAVIVPVGSVVDYKVTDEGGHTCDQWCFKKTLAAIEFTYTVDLPDIPYAYLHVHDWWHWHDKWWFSWFNYFRNSRFN